jgi:hypothetical protein
MGRGSRRSRLSLLPFPVGREHELSTGSAHDPIAGRRALRRRATP